MKTKLKNNSHGNFQFCGLDDLINLWVNTYYQNKVVLVIFNAYKAFESIPALAILKRDNLKVYNLGIKSSFVFIEYDSPEKACDFCYNFEHKKELRWVIYNNGKIHRISLFNME